MKGSVVVGVVCLTALPVLAGPVNYTFEVSSGSFSIDVLPDNFVTPDPVDVPLGGTFAITIYDDDGQLGPGDTFTLGAANIYNAEQKVLSFVAYAGTATFPAGGTKIVGFDTDTPGQISEGPIGTIDPDVHVVSDLVVAGITDPWYCWMNGYWYYETWSRLEVETFTIAFQVDQGIPVGVTLDGEFTYTYRMGGLDVGQIGQSVQLQGFVIPEPGSVGLIALAVGAAATRLRRRIRR